REQRLARAGRPDQQDVRLLELDLPGGRRRVDALVVVVHGHRERLLRAVLADDVVIEDALDLGRLRQLAAGRRRFALALSLEDVVAQLHALAADVHRRSGDESGDLVLASPAERAADRVRRRDALLHGWVVSSTPGKSSRPRTPGTAAFNVASR